MYEQIKECLSVEGNGEGVNGEGKGGKGMKAYYNSFKNHLSEFKNIHLPILVEMSRFYV